MANRSIALAAAFSAALLTACGGSSSGPEASGLNAPAPTALRPSQNAAANQALTGPVNEGELRKAIERYRVTKQRSASHYDFAGADLNGDGRPEALVLFSGQDWCVRTGCSLVIFQEEETGYKAVSHVTRVRPAIRVGPDSNFGWRDLVVDTGGGPAPIRTVRLGFTGQGYPINALLQPEPLPDMIAQSQPVISESRAFRSAFSAAAGQSSAQ